MLSEYQKHKANAIGAGVAAAILIIFTICGALTNWWQDEEPDPLFLPSLSNDCTIRGVLVLLEGDLDIAAIVPISKQDTAVWRVTDGDSVYYTTYEPTVDNSGQVSLKPYFTPVYGRTVLDEGRIPADYTWHNTTRLLPLEATIEQVECLPTLKGE